MSLMSESRCRLEEEPLFAMAVREATRHDPVVIRKILAHLGRAQSRPSPGPAPPESGAAAP